MSYKTSMVLLNLSHLPSPDKGLVIIEKIICKKQFDSENQGGGWYVCKSGCATKYAFWRERGNGDLEKSRFYWVFLNVGLPKRSAPYTINISLRSNSVLDLILINNLIGS